MQNTAKQNYPNLVDSYNTARKQGGLILQCSGANTEQILLEVWEIAV